MSEGLKPFRVLPASLAEWSKWARDQKVLNSDPPDDAKKRVTNIYYDTATEEVVFVYDDA